MLIFTVLEKQKFKRRKKDYCEGCSPLICPRKVLGFVSSRSSLNMILKMICTGSVSSSGWNDKANVGLQVWVQEGKVHDLRAPSHSKAPGDAEKALAFGQGSSMYTHTHTHSFHTMAWCKESREIALQATDSPTLLVTLPSSSQFSLAAGLGNDSGRQTVGRS